MIVAEIDVPRILELVAGQPLSYVALVILVAAWCARWYFFYTVKKLEAFKAVSGTLPEKDRLSGLQMAVLGFPGHLTEGRLQVLKMRYGLVAYVVTAVTVVVLSGLVIHSLSSAPIDRKIQSEIKDGVDELGRSAKATEGSVEKTQTDVITIKDELLVAQDRLNKELNDERDKGKTLVIALSELRAAATIEGQKNPKLQEFADRVRVILNRYEATASADPATVASARDAVDRATHAIVTSDEAVSLFFRPAGDEEADYTSVKVKRGEKIAITAGRYQVVVRNDSGMEFYFGVKLDGGQLYELK